MLGLAAIAAVTVPLAAIPSLAHDAMTSAAAPAADSAALAAEKPFLDGNDAAMDTMMAHMTIRPSGDVDKDFVDMMVPHHQGAIDMAALELRYGHNAKLKALAQEIVVTQQQEIAAMRLAVGEPLPPSAPSPTATTAPAAATAGTTPTHAN
jgi:uncharacterized protein (DUF305 family)